MKLLKQPRWNPYAVGVGIGVLSWVTFGLMHKALGTSTTLPKVAGFINGLASSEHVQANAYYAKLFNADKGKVMFDWQFFLVLMLPVGAFIAAKLANSKFTETVPALWSWRFGDNRLKRYALAFLGGAIMLFGARMADGCTSGHGLSGGLQLAVSSWTFFIAMFASGLVTAFALFGKEGRQHV